MKPPKLIKIPRVLCLFDYACNTGFATVSKNIIAELKKRFGSNLELDIVSINYFGPEYIEEGACQVRVCSAKLNDPQLNDEKQPDPDPFGRVCFLSQLTNADYTGIFIIQDLNVITGSKKGGAFTDLLSEIKRRKKEAGRINFKSIVYFPVDCGLIPLQVQGLEMFDMLVSYTEFGKQAILKHSPDLKGKINVIPHGNNKKDFYPINDQKEIKEFRQEFFGETDANPLFIITNVNRNQPRKDLPNTIFGFIEAKESWPAELKSKPFLYLHTNPEDTEGWDLRIVFQQTGLVEGVDYMLTPKEIQEQGATTEFMNIVYNASDVYLTTTTGEGWGLTITEAMATKTPVIATNYSSIPEMTNFGERAWLLETLYPHCSPAGMIRYQTDLYEVADKINEVAKAANTNSPEYCQKIDAAYKYVLSLDWQIICNRWAESFHQVFGVPYKK